MYNSWYYLRACEEQLQKTTAPLILGQPFTFRKGELNLPLIGHPQVSAIILNVAPPLPGFRLSAELPTPRKRVTLLEQVNGLVVSAIYLHQSNRAILLQCGETAGYLLLQSYGLQGNVFFFDNDLQWRAAFRKTKKPPSLNPAEFQRASSAPELTFSEYTEIFQRLPDSSLRELLLKPDMRLLSRTLVDAILQRLDLDPHLLAVNLSTAQRELLIQQIMRVKQALRQPVFNIYDGEPPALLLMDLAVTRLPVQTFPDVVSATRHFVTIFFRWHNLVTQKRQALRRTSILLSQTQRRWHKLQQDLDQLPTLVQFRTWADLIMANLTTIPEHTASWETTTLTTPAQPIRIPLDEKLTALANAQKYYALARNVSRTRQQLTATLEATRAQSDHLTALLSALENAADRTLITNLLRQISDDSSGPAANAVPALPYRRLLMEGWEILIGKSARDNDRLIREHARPHDFWLHAENTPGSHVVVRNPRRATVLPQPVLLKAAGIAAFFSQAKHSALVPVLYTQRKYISRPKRGEPGQVTVHHAKTIMIAPHDPRTDT